MISIGIISSIDLIIENEDSLGHFKWNMLSLDNIDCESGERIRILGIRLFKFIELVLFIFILLHCHHRLLNFLIIFLDFLNYWSLSRHPGLNELFFWYLSIRSLIHLRKYHVDKSLIHLGSTLFKLHFCFPSGITIHCEKSFHPYWCPCL